MSDGEIETEGHASERQNTENRASLAEERTEWAEERTEWANLRTLLAKERTFSGWLRTGLAALVTGLAVLRFLGDDGGGATGVGEVGRPALVTALGTLLVVTSGAIFVLAFVSYRKALRELQEMGIRGLPTWLLGGLTGAMVLGAVLGLLVLL